MTISLLLAVRDSIAVNNGEDSESRYGLHYNTAQFTII